MGYMSIIKASVTSHKGIIKSKNEDNFYMNGRFMYEHETDSVQVSVENKSDNFIFSVSDSMDIVDKEKEVSISITKEFNKYHKKAEYKENDLDTKTGQLANIVSEASKLINSIYSDVENFTYPSVACLLIKDNKAYVISLGSCKAFIIRSGFIRQLTSDWEKTQRLLKLGIITDEQAYDLAKRYGIPTENSIIEVQKSEEITLEEGDIFVLSTNGLTDQIEIEDINEAFKTNRELERAVNFLVKSVLKKGEEDNITVMAVRIEKINNTYIKEAVPSQKIPRKKTLKSILALLLIKLIKKARKFNMRKVYSSIIASVLILAVLIGGIRLIKTLSGKKASNNGLDHTTTQSNYTTGLNSNDNVNNTENDDNNITDSSLDSTSQDTEKSGEESSSGINILPTRYTVKKGDTLYNISEHFYGDASKYKVIMEYNNITDPTKIQIGQVLDIPDINAGRSESSNETGTSGVSVDVD